MARSAARAVSLKEKTLLAGVNTNGKQVLLNQQKSVYYNYHNANSHNVILNFDGDSSCFIIYDFQKDHKRVECTLEKRGDNTLAAVFISKDTPSNSFVLRDSFLSTLIPQYVSSPSIFIAGAIPHLMHSRR